jgi:hypothetical protein
MGDRFEIDLNALPGIVKSLGDRARDADSVLDDARDLVSTVQNLVGSCEGAGGSVTLAWSYIDRARTGLFNLQRDVAARAMTIARSECNSDLATDIENAVKPPKKGGGWLNVVHIGLDGIGLLPVVGEPADGINALIYLGQGDYKNAAISGAGLIPFVGMAGTGARMVGRGVKVAKGVRRGADDVDEVAGGLGTVARPSRPAAGTPAHKQSAWEKYQANGGQWSYERWSKQYDVNINNPTKSNKLMDQYRDALKWPDREATVRTPDGATRRLDIANVAKKRGVEHKTGYHSRTPEILSEIERDKKLVDDGWNIVWVFENGKASKPLQQELRNAGIPFVFE